MLPAAWPGTKRGRAFAVREAQVRDGKPVALMSKTAVVGQSLDSGPGAHCETSSWMDSDAQVSRTIDAARVWALDLEREPRSRAQEAGTGSDRQANGTIDEAPAVEPSTANGSSVAV